MRCSAEAPGVWRLHWVHRRRSVMRLPLRDTPVLRPALLPARRVPRRVATVTPDEFLVARIAEDRSAALSLPQVIIDAAVAHERIHFARWTPARVVAECDARLQIVEAYRHERSV